MGLRIRNKQVKWSVHLGLLGVFAAEGRANMENSSEAGFLTSTAFKIRFIGVLGNTPEAMKVTRLFKVIFCIKELPKQNSFFG